MASLWFRLSMMANQIGAGSSTTLTPGIEPAEADAATQRLDALR
jgi:hypothetical protein